MNSLVDNQNTVYIVSRDHSCPLIQSFFDYQQASANKFTGEIYWISHIYLYSSLFHPRLIPLQPMKKKFLTSIYRHQQDDEESLYNPFHIPKEDLVHHWSILFPSSTDNTGHNVTTSQTDYLASLGNFFSVLYYPQLIYPPSKLLSEMKSCVISLSGYRDRDISDRELQDPNIYHVADEKGERYGRRELKQAIRFTGACYSGPLLRYNFVNYYLWFIYLFICLFLFF